MIKKEKETKNVYSYYISDQVAEEVKKLAKEEDVIVSECVDYILKEFFNNREIK